MMKTKTLSYRIPGMKWSRVDDVEHRTVENTSGEYTYRRQETAQETHVERSADFVVEIDIAVIIDLIVGRAMHTKSLKSQLLDKLIRCRAENVVIHGKRVVDLPMREGHRLVGEGKRAR